MTDQQKEDLQFWLYTQVYIDGATPAAALAAASREVGVEPAAAFAYLKADGRVTGTLAAFDLSTFDSDQADPEGVYVDIEWMMQLLHRAGYRGERLWQALGSIYKLPAHLAREEAEQIPIVEGEG